jgi:hypothetical protein
MGVIPQRFPLNIRADTLEGTFEMIVIDVPIRIADGGIIAKFSYLTVISAIYNL